MGSIIKHNGQCYEILSVSPRGYELERLNYPAIELYFRGRDDWMHEPRYKIVTLPGFYANQFGIGDQFIPYGDNREWQTRIVLSPLKRFVQLVRVVGDPAPAHSQVSRRFPNIVLANYSNNAEQALCDSARSSLCTICQEPYEASQGLVVCTAEAIRLHDARGLHIIGHAGCMTYQVRACPLCRKVDGFLCEWVYPSDVVPPATAGAGACADLSSDVQAAVIEQITTPGPGYNECPMCMESLYAAGAIWVCNVCKKAVGHVNGVELACRDKLTCCCNCQSTDGNCLVQWTPPAGLKVRSPAPAGAVSGAGTGAGAAGAGAGAGVGSGGAAGVGAGPEVLATVGGVQQLRVSSALPILAAQRAGSLPAGFITANTLVRFGTTVAYILAGGQYQILPPEVVVGPIDEYKVSNSRATAPRGYTKVASFSAADDDEMFIYRQNAPTS
jgi:hypothetical protein